MMSYRPHLLEDHMGLGRGRGISQVMPGLYVGNLQDSKDSIQLEHHNITHIVSIHDTARRVFKEFGFGLFRAKPPNKDVAVVRKQRRKEKVKEEKEWKGVYLEREQVSGKWVDILVINKAEQEMEQQQEQQGAEEGEEEEGSVEPYPANVLTARLRVKDKEYLILLAADSPDQNMLQFISQVNDFVHSARLARSSVLIHCLAGMSRSVFLAASYLLAATSITAGDSLRVVRTARRMAAPNPGFLRQLAEWEASGAAAAERRRMEERFYNHRYSEDEDWVQERLDTYCRLVARGDLCQGNCRRQSVCPLGSCRPLTSSGHFHIFQRRQQQGQEYQSSSLPSSPVRRKAPPAPPLSGRREGREDREAREAWQRREERRIGTYRLSGRISSLDHCELEASRAPARTGTDLRLAARARRSLPRSPARKTVSVPNSPRFRT